MWAAHRSPTQSAQAEPVRETGTGDEGQWQSLGRDDMKEGGPQGGQLVKMGVLGEGMGTWGSLQGSRWQRGRGLKGLGSQRTIPGRDF